MDKPHIIADHRERDIQRCIDQSKCFLEEKQLPVGDFILSHRVGVERKRIADFLQSIVDQRIFSQLERLSAAYERPLLVLEGNPELLFLERNIHENTIRGVLASIAIDFQIPIIWTQNTQETADQLFWIAHREQGGKRSELAIRGSRKSLSFKQQQEFLIAGLPGINSKRSKKLLSHFKTPEKVFRATEKQLIRVEGFGDKIIKQMKSLLKSEYAD